jgi:GumC protein
MQELSPDVIHSSPPLRREEETVLRWPLFEEELRIWDYWRVLKTRGWLITAFFSGVLLVTVLGLFLVTPTYTALTTLLIEQRTPQVLDIREVLSEVVGPLDENDYYKTQYEILKSRSLAAQVIKEQGLEAVFTEEAQAAGWLATLQAGIKAGLARFFPAPAQSSGGGLFGVNSDLIDAYIDDKLEITPISHTRLVQVAFSASDPELAARVANAHARTYVRQGLGMRNRVSEEAQNFLQEHLVELKQRVEKSEAALNRYRKDKKIISLDDKENIVVERLADLNKRLTEAEAERIALAGQVHLVNRGYYDSLPAVIGNPLIHDLKDQLARLEGDHARLAAQFTMDYPRMVQLTAQVEETQRSLRREIQRVVDATQSAYLAAQAKEKELRTKMEEQKAATLSLKDAAVEYAILAREVDTNLQLYNSVLQRMKEMGVTAELRASNVFVIDEAEPPLQPAKP